MLCKVLLLGLSLSLCLVSFCVFGLLVLLCRKVMLLMRGMVLGLCLSRVL